MRSLVHRVPLPHALLSWHIFQNIDPHGAFDVFVCAGIPIILVGNKFGRMGRHYVLYPGCAFILELDVFCGTHRGE